MACDECKELNSHAFRSSDDLVHAFQVAATELDRGVLARVQVESLSAAEQEALSSIFAANALPDALRYLFRCTVCGDAFELVADTNEGSGSWKRQDEPEGR